MFLATLYRTPLPLYHYYCWGTRVQSAECRMQWTVKHWRTRYKKASTVDIEKLNPTVSFHAGAARASHGFTEKSRRMVRWSLCTMVLASPVHTGITGIDIHPILTHIFWHAFLKVSTDKAVSSGSCSSELLVLLMGSFIQAHHSRSLWANWIIWKQHTPYNVQPVCFGWIGL